MPSHLQLVNDSDQAIGKRFSIEALGPALGRPGDRAEPLSFERTKGLVELAAAAPRAGLPFELAVSLLAQRQLVMDDLGASGPCGDTFALDHAARTTSVAVALSGSVAGYVRDLQRRAPLKPTHPPAQMLIPLPLRIVDRLRVGDRHRGLSSRWLGQARAWELAGAIQGRTMAEWAMLVMVRSAATGG